MICVRLEGGLGNQMFQYSCGRALAFKFSTDLVFDVSALKWNMNGNGVTVRSFELDKFEIIGRPVAINELRHFKPLYLRIANVISFWTRSRGIQFDNYFVENRFSYNPAIEMVGPKCYLAGYWQSPRYFQFAETLIRKDFEFGGSLDIENRDRIERIKFFNSVSLHIRRSDFVNNKFHDIHGTCSIDYYKRAIEQITLNTLNLYFFVFSDDIEWAKKNLNLEYPVEFVSGNTGKNNYIDMQLMSSCKHNIIANSSFSWWGAWLNPNPEKIVIAPEHWFIDEKLNAETSDLIPKEWIRL